MINFCNHLFATYSVENFEVKVTCDRDENGNPVETDVMPFLTKGNLTYLYNVLINRISSDDDDEVVFTINGIEQPYNYGVYALDNVLVKSLTVNKDCSFYIKYNL